MSPRRRRGWSPSRRCRSRSCYTLLLSGRDVGSCAPNLHKTMWTGGSLRLTEQGMHPRSLSGSVSSELHLQSGHLPVRTEPSGRSGSRSNSAACTRTADSNRNHPSSSGRTNPNSAHPSSLGRWLTRRCVSNGAVGSAGSTNVSYSASVPCSAAGLSCFVSACSTALERWLTRRSMSNGAVGSVSRSWSAYA